MKVFDCIKMTALLLGLDDVYDEMVTFESSENYSYNIDSTVVNKVNKMIGELNNVIVRVASDYIVMKTSEELASNNEGKIAISAFAYYPQKVLKITEKMTGREVKSFRFLLGYLMLPKNLTSYIVEYKMYPDIVNNLIDEILLPPTISTRTLSYALCSDEMLAAVDFDEADIWDKKFEKCIRLNLQKAEPKKYKHNSFL